MSDHAEIILPPDEVCACLSETGERTVRIYERCERCRALMESDYPERLDALVAERDRYRDALEQISEERCSTGWGDMENAPHCGCIVCKARAALAEGSR